MRQEMEIVLQNTARGVKAYSVTGDLSVHITTITPGNRTLDQVIDYFRAIRPEYARCRIGWI